MESEGLTLYDLSPGKRVADRYCIVDANRQGGLSTAFEVRDERTGDRCEMQLFPAGLFDGPSQKEEFHSILSPWLKVDSASVLRVREILLLEPGTLALITDFPGGDALRTRLKRKKRLDATEVLRLGCHVLDGLEEIHRHQLVHGDIKPSTVHVHGRGGDLEALLVDGGVTPALWTAKDLGDKTAMIGTPYYAPIEQFGGDSPNVQSDIYNLATVLFESLTGVLPWSGSTFMEVFQAKLDKRPPSMKERAPKVAVDPALEQAIVTGCLADRSQRYSSASEFREALTALE